MSAIEFTTLNAELKSEDNDKGKKRKADHMTMIVNDWMPYPSPGTSCYIGKSIIFPLISDYVFFWLNNVKYIWYRCMN